MTGDVPIQGQGSSRSLKTPPDVFEAKREVDGGIPSEGGIEPSDPTAWNQDPHDYSLASLESASAAASRPLSNGGTGSHLNSPLTAHQRSSKLAHRG
jgi:hypothetical protein